MEYTKIKVTSKDDAKRFYRVIAVKGDPDLYTLGAIIGYSVQAWFEHMYLFRKKDVSYVPDMWLEDISWGEQYSMGQTHLSDLGETFTFEYDTGEGWEFNCKVLKRKATYFSDDEYPLGFVVEGKGQGIFENDHATFWRYLGGEIKPNSRKEGEDPWQFLPMNMDFKTYGDFDLPLDLDAFVFYQDQIEEITKQFTDIEETEEEEKRQTIDLLTRAVADKIFNDEFTNNIFRKLIDHHDMNEAYEMIVVNIAQTMATIDENMSDDEVLEMINHNLTLLK